MRLHAGLPKFFWADAISTAAYLINRGPSVPLNGELLEEAWTGKEVTLLHLRVFGCVSYMHVDSNDRYKLDPKSRKCYFIGYGSDDFGYRFWMKRAGRSSGGEMLYSMKNNCTSTGLMWNLKMQVKNCTG